ncbi:hypothetical protein HDU98_008605 [Podochytrium sp. JEL0797]|nr:hypothetical protein HDU98_008605 [Podochytrium sp. JEL0797]
MDHVYDTHLAHLSRMTAILHRTTPTVMELMWQFQAQLTSPAVDKKSLKGQHRKTASATPKPLSLDAFAAKTAAGVSTRDMREAVLICRQLIGRGNMLFAFALQRDGLLHHPPHEFYSQQITYTHRFKIPLGLGTPPPQPYTDFTAAETAFLGLTSPDLLSRSYLFYNEAKTMLEFLTPYLARVEEKAVTVVEQGRELAALLAASGRNAVAVERLGGLDPVTHVASGGGAVDWKARGLAAAGDKREKCFGWEMEEGTCVAVINMR